MIGKLEILIITSLFRGDFFYLRVLNAKRYYSELNRSGEKEKKGRMKYQNKGSYNYKKKLKRLDQSISLNEDIRLLEI